MIFKGNLIVTTDMEMVKNMIGTHRIVVIGEPSPEFVASTGAVVGSILLPPYPAMMALMDNNINAFMSAYSAHLNTKECTTFFAVLFKAMMQGSNILLYLTQDEYNMYYKYLEMYLVNVYGIYVGSAQNNYTFNVAEQFAPAIYSVLYLSECITIEELFKLYPQGARFDQNVVMKLISEMRPVLNTNTFQAYEQYFYDYKESVKQTNTYMPNLFTRKI